VRGRGSLAPLELRNPLLVFAALGQQRLDFLNLLVL